MEDGKDVKGKREDELDPGTVGLDGMTEKKSVSIIAKYLFDCQNSYYFIKQKEY